jgi:MFS family permease
MVLADVMNLTPIAYLSSYTLSLLGNSIAGIALPLIVLQTTGSALGAGTVAAATAIPALLAGLLMGVVIDRINRRTSSVVTDLVSAGAIAALPVVDMLSGLTIGWFVLFGIIGSLGDVPGLTARDALLPAIVRHGSMSAEKLMGLREALGAIAILLGPAAAGTLMVLFEGSTVLWITAATSLGAALITLLIPHRIAAVGADTAGAASTRAGEDVEAASTSAGESAGATSTRAGEGAGATSTTLAVSVGRAWSDLRDGWRVLFRSPFLMATTVISLASVLVLAALQGIVLPVHFVVLGEPGLLGFVLSAVAVGLLAGGALYAMIGARISRRGWFVAGIVGTTVGLALISVLASTWLVFVGAFVIGFASGLSGALMGVLMIERIPDAMRGRVMGTQNSLMTVVPSVGILAAAVLTEFADLRVAALVLTGVWVVVAIGALAARSLRTLEIEVVVEAPESAAPAADRVG